MGKIDFPSIFRRKVKVHSGEAILTRQQMDAYQMSKALHEVLDDIEDEGVEISEAELEQRINEVCKEYGITPTEFRDEGKEAERAQ